MALLPLLRLHPLASTMPPGTRKWLYAGVFVAFGSIGAFVCMLSYSEPPGWVAGLIAIALAGTLAIGWSAMFIERAWWLLLVVVPLSPFLHRLTFDAMWRNEAVGRPLLLTGTQLSVGQRMTVLCAMGIATVFAGYFLTIRVVRRLEASSGRMRAEFDVARKVHDSLVPGIALSVQGLEVHGSSRASAEMGGDLIDLIRTGDRTDIILADVSGHGVGAGIVMGMLKSSARTLLRRHTDLGPFLADLNAVLTDLVRPGTFATAAVVRIDTDRPGIISYAMAGHLPLFLARRAGGIEELRNEAFPLGIDPDERFPVGQVALATGDTLMLFTDGLTEVLDRSGRQLGLPTLREVFERHAAQPLPAIAAALRALADAHGKQSDDQSLVLIRV
jgi:hypothetical protein